MAVLCVSKEEAVSKSHPNYAVKAGGSECVRHPSPPLHSQEVILASDERERERDGVNRVTTLLPLQ